MKEETREWTWSDGWILMSVYLAQSGKEAGLTDIIAADATNHAIPTPSELTHAFTKLINAGVLIIKDNKYKISDKHLTAIEKAYKGRGGLFESANKGLKWLKSSCLSVIEKPKVIITRQEAKNAYNEYASRI